MFLGFKRVLVTSLMGVIVILLGSTKVNATTNEQTVQDVQDVQESGDIIKDEIAMYTKKGASINTFSTDEEIIYTVEITDKKELEKYDKTGEGKLESRTITYILPKEDNNAVEENLNQSTYASPAYTISGWSYESNRNYNTTEGTPFRIEGKANYSYKATTSTTYKLYGEGSGKVKGLVEIKLGGEIGSTSTKEWTIAVDVPEGYYRDFEVWEYLSKYTFNVLSDGNSYATGCSAYKPNGGQKLTNDLYKK